MPTFDLYQLLALIILAILGLTLIWLVRHKPYVIVKVFWVFQVVLRDTPPDEPKKPPKKD